VLIAQPKLIKFTEWASDDQFFGNPVALNFDDLDEDGQTAAWAWVAAIAKEGRCRNDEDFIVAACKFIREQLVPEKKREIIQKLKRTKLPPAV
jgi:hypothetical protein